MIVGSGFGGIKAALELAKDARFSITVIGEYLDFRIYGSLYRVATGGSLKVASVPVRDIFVGKNVTFVQATATKLDRSKRLVMTKDKQSFFYDAVIFALGVKTNYFGIKGLEQYAFGIKTPADAEALKTHLHKQLGDHPSASSDSREFGWIDRASVQAKVFWPHAPKNRAEHVD